MIRNKELRTLKFAQKKLDSFIDASRGEDSGCASFRGMEPFTEEQKRAIRVYVDTWIKEPLDCAIKAIEGDRSYANEEDLTSWSRP